MSRTWYPYRTRSEWLSDGVNQAWDVETASIGKEGSAHGDANQYLIANEWICGSIAQIMRLPIPPFALMRKDGDKGMFVSLHCGIDTPPEDSNPGECLEANLEVCTGVLIFDIFVANFDRHAGNIKIKDSKSPEDMYIIDHERALFGYMWNEVDARFKYMKDRLGLQEELYTRPGASHCFLRSIEKADYFHRWIGVIERIPDEFIHDICYEMVGLGIDEELADKGRDFLLYRKKNLSSIIETGKPQFQSITDWGLFI